MDLFNVKRVKIEWKITHANVIMVFIVLCTVVEAMIVKNALKNVLDV